MQRHNSKNDLEWSVVSTPLGLLQVGLYGGKLCSLSFGNNKALEDWARRKGLSLKRILKIPSSLKAQIDLYFQGRLKKFRIPTVFLTGTPFERKVWDALKTIPYGEVKSYKWVAQKIGKPQAVRAVGQANGKNCLPIVIPCHRVISSNGGLGGYSGGVGLKKRLLELEGVISK